jgi:hypothetical protein
VEVPFRFGWLVFDGEWERARQVVTQHAPDSEYDTALYALDELLVGRLWFERWGKLEVPALVARPLDDAGSLPPGLPLRVIDVAWQLAKLVEEGGFGAASGPTPASFRDSMGPLTLVFRQEGDGMVIEVDETWAGDWRLEVPSEAFSSAMHTFLVEVATALHQQLPGFASWDTFRPLRPFVGAAR